MAGGRAFAAVTRRICEIWALAGGAVLLAVIAINMISVIGTIVASPFPGDFELTEMGVAIAAFAFLPYCQISGANVTADIFTAAASTRFVAVLGLVGAAVALLFSGLLIWRMYFGMMDQMAYDYTTAILQIRHWWAFVPILLSLALLALAAVASMAEQSNIARHGARHD